MSMHAPSPLSNCLYRLFCLASFAVLAVQSVQAQRYSLKIVDSTNGSGLYVTAPAINDNGDVAYVKQGAGVPVNVSYTVNGVVATGPALNTLYGVSNGYSWFSAGIPNPAPMTLSSMGAWPEINSSGVPL